MDGLEVRRLRRASGMSQAEFGIAVGISRETVCRIERSAEHLDRRTELAIRYVAEGKAVRVPGLSEIHEEVAHILDQTAARGQPPYDYRERVQSAAAHWRARQGSTEVARLMRQVEGVLGMLNVTRESDRMRDHAIQALLDMKQRWRAAAAEEIPLAAPAS